jgi:hypothetical protein
MNAPRRAWIDPAAVSAALAVAKSRPGPKPKIEDDEDEAPSPRRLFERSDRPRTYKAKGRAA